MTRTVLVADDEEFIVDLLATLLEDEGYTALRAYDGEQALALARRHQPHLIITDIMMPKMSGTELAARIRALGNPLGRVPIVLMSAVSGVALPCGALYLAKPFNIDHVLALVARLTG
ncbi:MAG TPA: response regulator [Thermomicrobiales bacterium]|nr:response regulator [Thermomicrobiales bacterium]